jgi:hypothetical protein
MGITNNIPPSRLIQPGVIDNTAARPASPFEGQCIFQKDTDQLLVWNGTAWVIPNQTTTNPEGLELVKVQTVGTTVSSVTVSDAFSATYDYYKIVYTNGIGSTQAAFRLTLGATTTGYYTSVVLSRYDGVGVLSGGTSNGAYFDSVGFSDPIGNLCEIELSMPFLARKTGCKAHHWDTRTGGGTGFGPQGGHLNNTTSYTAFTLTCSSGTITGGQIRVYGYRNS